VSVLTEVTESLNLCGWRIRAAVLADCRKKSLSPIHHACASDAWPILTVYFW